MKVADQISNSINKNSRLKRLWLCPQIVRNPRVGREYVLEIAITSKLGTKLSDAEVTKCWTEGDCLCITYAMDDESIAIGVDKLLDKQDKSINNNDDNND